MTSPKLSTRLAAAISSIAVAVSIASVSANARPASLEAVAASGVVKVEAFRRIHEGMTAAEVRSLLGPPADTMRFPLSRTTAWEYPFRDTWGYDSDFSVIIDDSDVVVGTFAGRRDAG
jgi:outer membrane protein assembly factor BamE (lipoprotein component of BamABCDE complex)